MDPRKQKIIAVIVIAGVFFLGFGLGILTAREKNPAPIIIEKYSEE